MWGKGRHINCNASLSQPNVQKNSKAHVRERGGGGLKFEKNAEKKTIKPTPKKKVDIGSPVFCTFSFTLDPIT